MKFFFLLLISLSAGAANWVPVSKIQPGNVSAYQLQVECEKQGEQCLDIGDEPEAMSAGFASTENNWGPKLEIEECSGQEDCETKLGAKICAEGEKFINQALTEVYCSVLLGKVLVIDAAGFSAHKAAQATARAMELAKAGAKKLRECGQGVFDLVLVRNGQKQPVLSTTEVKQIVSTFAPIKGLLETGSLNSAKEEVQAVVPDGRLVTADDKTAIIAAIDACIGGP